MFVVGTIEVQYLNVFLKLHIKVKDVIFFIVVDSLGMLMVICYVCYK